MYNYNEFIQNIQNQISKIFDDCNVTVNVVTKNNGVVLTGLYIKDKTSGMIPTIYLDEYYYDYQNGVPFQCIVEHIVKVYKENKDRIVMNVSDFRNFELARERIFFKLVNYRKNTELLKTIPHTKFLDLAIIYYYSVEDELDSDCMGYIIIKNEHLEMWGISVETLHGSAESNTPQFFKYELKSLADTMYGLLEQKDFQESLEMQEAFQVYVLTNNRKLNGAICILYPEILKQFAEKMQCDLLIIPSSIHEVLLTPAKDVAIEDISCMVQEVNKAAVLDEEILSDKVYYYSRAENQILIP